MERRYICKNEENEIKEIKRKYQKLYQTEKKKGKNCKDFHRRQFFFFFISI